MTFSGLNLPLQPPLQLLSPLSLSFGYIRLVAVSQTYQDYSQLFPQVFASLVPSLYLGLCHLIKDHPIKNSDLHASNTIPLTLFHFFIYTPWKHL